MTESLRNLLISRHGVKIRESYPDSQHFLDTPAPPDHSDLEFQVSVLYKQNYEHQELIERLETQISDGVADANRLRAEIRALKAQLEAEKERNNSLSKSSATQYLGSRNTDNMTKEELLQYIDMKERDHAFEAESYAIRNRQLHEQLEAQQEYIQKYAGMYLYTSQLTNSQDLSETQKHVEKLKDMNEFNQVYFAEDYKRMVRDNGVMKQTIRELEEKIKCQKELLDKQFITLEQHVHEMFKAHYENGQNMDFIKQLEQKQLSEVEELRKTIQRLEERDAAQQEAIRSSAQAVRDRDNRVAELEREGARQAREFSTYRKCMEESARNVRFWVEQAEGLKGELRRQLSDFAEQKAAMLQGFDSVLCTLKRRIEDIGAAQGLDSVERQLDVLADEYQRLAAVQQQESALVRSCCRALQRRCHETAGARAAGESDWPGAQGAEQLARRIAEIAGDVSQQDERLRGCESRAGDVGNMADQLLALYNMEYNSLVCKLLNVEADDKALALDLPSFVEHLAKKRPM